MDGPNAALSDPPADGRAELPIAPVELAAGEQLDGDRCVQTKLARGAAEAIAPR